MSIDISRPRASQTLQKKKVKDHHNKSEKTKRKRPTDEDAQSNEDLRTKKRKSNPSQIANTILSKSGDDINSLNLSPFHQESSSLYLPLSPICQLFPLQGLCAEHLSPLILTYYPPFGGVVLSYSNARLTENPHKTSRVGATGGVLAKSVDEYAVSFVWLTAEFLVFKPQEGGWIEGWINLQNEGHIGLVCWNLFNASIEAKQLPKEWKWIPAETHSRLKAKLKRSRGEVPVEQEANTAEASPLSSEAVHEDEGHFEDADGRKVKGSIRFRVKDVETSSSTDREKSFLRIEGTLLSPEDEAILDEGLTEEDDSGVSGRTRGASYMMSEALVGGQLDDTVDSSGNSIQKSKHRIKH